MSNSKAKEDFWKRKLLAYLHDPPCKPLDISPEHEGIAWDFAKSAIPGDDQEWLKDTVCFVKDADWWASAADRFTFASRKTSAKFTGKKGATFKHPLGGAEYEMDSLPEVDYAQTLLQNAIGGVTASEDADETETARQHFFLYWRRWLEQTVLSQSDRTHARNLAYYPADTRIPDHTIWNHITVTSAIEGCRVEGNLKPSFLIFQLGPVQDFIASARSTRDLWSGSYLLSWMTAHAIKSVTDLLGPDSVIFPSLRGSGIFDALNREDLFSKITFKSGENGEKDTLWHRMYADGNDEEQERNARRLLNPSLPNRFVALVPENAEGKFGKAAELAVKAVLARISETCWDHFKKLIEKAGSNDALLVNMKQRWDAQVAALPQVSWVEVPWEHDIEQAMEKFTVLPVNKLSEEGSMTAFDVLSKNYEFAKKGGYKPDNAGFLWSMNYHRAEFALAARRNTREFEQFITDDSQAECPKDALTGKEEIIGSEVIWDSLRKNGGVFKGNEGPYGAISIIKRLWWRDECRYLKEKLALHPSAMKKAMSIDSIADIAKLNSAGDSKEKDPETGERKPENPYVAVIAMDGDEMGKWISGAKTPKLLEQVANGAIDYLKEIGVKEELPRPLTPSYHMQFSEALSNFANHVADLIVRHYKGQLIYAGGDDVLAMLPADNALTCARALRAAFRGKGSDLPELQRNYKMATTQDGFLLTEENYPIIVPGPASEVSCGIAIAHYQHPLQKIVHEAHAAEKRAKRGLDDGGLGRGAFALSLMKRGGETVHWGAKWDDGALELYDLYMQLRKSETLGARFPYALAGLLAPYDLEGRKGFDKLTSEELQPIIEQEFAHVCQQQSTWSQKSLEQETGEAALFKNTAHTYLKTLGAQQLHQFPKLFLAAAFIHRDRVNEIQKGGK